MVVLIPLGAQVRLGDSNMRDTVQSNHVFVGDCRILLHEYLPLGPNDIGILRERTGSGQQKEVLVSGQVERATREGSCVDVRMKGIAAVFPVHHKLGEYSNLQAHIYMPEEEVCC